MILNNFKRAFAGAMSGSVGVPGGLRPNGTDSSFYNATNDTSSLFLNFPKIMSFVNSTNGLGSVFFGDGDTTPTPNDYNLAGYMFTATDIDVTASVKTVVDDDGVATTGTYTITNKTDAEITIREVCVRARCMYAASSSSYTHFMLDRTVLDSPVTIPAGGVGQVTYTIRMNYPT